MPRGVQDVAAMTNRQGKPRQSKTEFLISVVMPTLNCTSLLAGSLGSLAAQTCRNFEVIIVDGGSGDDTVAEARRQLEPFGIECRVIIAPGTGIYAAMNLGIAMARGQWLYFLGSDDRLYSPDVFETMAPYLQLSKANLVHGEAWIEKPGYLYGGEFSLRRLLERNISHQSIFYRRSLLISRRIGYNESYPIYADWDLNLKVLSFGSFQFIRVPVAVYSCDGFSAGRIDERFMREKEANAMNYFGWRAFLLMTPDRLALGASNQRSWLTTLILLFVRCMRAFARFFGRGLRY